MVREAASAGPAGGNLRLRNARLVYADDTVISGGLNVRDGVITRVFSGDGDDAFGETGGKDPIEIDAGGRYVLPGVIDPHVQLHHRPGFAEYAAETRSAALGGVTTIMKMHRDLEGYGEDEFWAEVSHAEERAYVDFAFHLALMSERQVANAAEYARTLKLSSFKMFMAYKGAEGLAIGIQGIDDGLLLEAFRAIAALGGVALVHCENQDLAVRALETARSDGRDDLAAFGSSRPPVVEAEAVQRACFLAREAGSDLYIVHVTCAAALAAALRARRGGQRLFIETEPHYLTETEESPAGSLAKVIPPVRSDTDRAALWGALSDGDLDTIGSDHVAHPRAAKAGSVWAAKLGFPGIATILPVLLSEAANGRGVSLGQVASLTSTRPADIFGLARKGRLVPGMDGDLVVIDLDLERTVDARDLGSNSDFSIYEGRPLRGWPVLTVSRGTIVMQDGQVVGEEGHGRYLRREPTNI
jgi:dihydropyrimidinase